MLIGCSSQLTGRDEVEKGKYHSNRSSAVDLEHAQDNFYLTRVSIRRYTHGKEFLFALDSVAAALEEIETRKTMCA